MFLLLEFDDVLSHDDVLGRVDVLRLVEVQARAVIAVVALDVCHCSSVPGEDRQSR